MQTEPKLRDADGAIMAVEAQVNAFCFRCSRVELRLLKRRELWGRTIRFANTFNAAASSSTKARRAAVKRVQMETSRGIGTSELRGFVKRTRIVSALFLLALGNTASPSVVAADTGACSRAISTQAETAIDDVDNWQELFDHFRAFGRCDDGALAEAYSDRVASFLATKWASIGTLNRLVRRSSAFRVFVLRHVNSLMTPDQAQTISENAKNKCPNAARALCADLALSVNDSP